jgi:hypothetical protein
MSSFIDWCNINNGFVSALLSVVGLLLSGIAIFVSIRTARLPYKKRLQLSFSKDFLLSRNLFTNQVETSTKGISVNAANTGSRNINITYLGLGVVDSSSFKGLQKMTRIDDKPAAKGMLAPSEILTEEFTQKSIDFSFTKLSKHTKVYLLAIDSEGRKYKKLICRAEKLIEAK